MKVAILYDSKYGNTKQLAEFIAEKIGAGGHEVQLFRTGETKPESLLAFMPEVIVVGAPTHAGTPAWALGRYLKKMKKLIEKGTTAAVQKAAVFNCNITKNVCEKIRNKVADVFPNISFHDKSLSIKVIETKGPLQERWDELATTFTSGILEFLK